jgi:hypothetical protein
MRAQRAAHYYAPRKRRFMFALHAKTRGLFAYQYTHLRIVRKHFLHSKQDAFLISLNACLRPNAYAKIPKLIENEARDFYFLEKCTYHLR